MRRLLRGRLRASMVLAVAWKDLLDLRRDTRTLLGIIILPFIGLPGLAMLGGLLASEQTVSICYVVEDSGDGLWVAQKIVNETVRILRSWGLNVSVREGLGGPCDLVLVVPKGFSSEIERLDGQAVVVASGSLGGAGQQALQALQIAVRRVAEEVALRRVESLAGMAGVSVDAERMLHPVRVEVKYHTAGGAPASGEMVRVSESARVLAFSLFFVVNPVVVFMSDAIAGERERRTLEMLLVSPLTKGEILAGKVIAASVAGLVGAVADSAGILAYFGLAGLSISLTPGLVAVWLVSAVGLIMFTAFLSGVIASRSGSARASQNVSFLVTMAAMAVYFSALIVDLTRVSGIAKLVLALFPFAQPALAIEYYSVGLPRPAAAYLAALLASSILAGALLSRAFDYERVVASGG